MTNEKSSSRHNRRRFLNGAVIGGTLAAGAFTGQAKAREKSNTPSHWEPARHAKDDWLDQLPGKHRLVFDTISYEHLSDAILFANNFIRVNRADYGLQSNELAVVIVVRHRSTPFGYNDAMWAKYGTAIALRSKVEDPKTKEPPKINLFNSRDDGDLNRGMTLDSVFKQGVQLAVCTTSTRGYAASIAQAVGGNADEIFKELTANLVSDTNCRMVPAGIVAVNRAQERGYSLVSI